MDFTFTIQGALPGLNEIIGAINKHRYAGAEQKKKEQKRCSWSIVAGRVPTFSVPVIFTFRWIEKDLRRDPDNICAGTKFILDALVEMKKIPRDSRRWVKGIFHEFPEPDKQNPRIEITIKEFMK